MATLLLRKKSKRVLRRERVFLDRTNPLDTLDDVDLISRYRFPGRVIRKLIDEIDPLVRGPIYKTHAIPTHIQVVNMYSFHCINFTCVSLVEYLAACSNFGTIGIRTSQDIKEPYLPPRKNTTQYLEYGLLCRLLL